MPRVRVLFYTQLNSDDNFHFHIEQVNSLLNLANNLFNSLNQGLFVLNCLPFPSQSLF